MSKRIIIQGDDLAYKPETDVGIAYAYENGVLTSTTVMTNLLKKVDKKRYQEFITSLENKSGLKKPGLGIGVHLNVTFGKPLSSGWPQSEFTRPHKGTGKPEEWQGSGWRAYLSQFTAKQAEDEYRRQIELAFEIFEEVDHLDSHQFSTSYKPFKPVFEKLAKEYKLPVRPDAPLSEKPVYGGDFVFKKESVDRLKSKGIKTADNYIFKLFFNEENPVKSFLREVDRQKADESAEIMFHPARGNSVEEWRLSDLNTLTSKRVLERFSAKDIQLINYSQL